MQHQQLKLLEDCDYQLQVLSGDGEGFVKQFRMTWQSLPKDVRDKISEFWNVQEFLKFELSCYTGNARATTRSWGTEIRFHDESFSCMPPAAARWIIAHELAHVYQKAIGRKPGGENEEENEKHADELVDSWGIDRACYMVILMRRDNSGVSFEEACHQIKNDKFLSKLCP